MVFGILNIHEKDMMEETAEEDPWRIWHSFMSIGKNASAADSALRYAQAESFI